MSLLRLLETARPVVEAFEHVPDQVINLLLRRHPLDQIQIKRMFDRAVFHAFHGGFGCSFVIMIHFTVHSGGCLGPGLVVRLSPQALHPLVVRRQIG